MLKENLKIAHLSSAHPRYDIRIFVKMCTSLANEGFDTYFVVADGLNDEVKNGVSIVDCGERTGGRLSRMTKTVRRVFNKAVKINADVYHLHDPELIPIGLKLKKMGKKVIFDAHEDLPKQIMGKPYLNALSKLVLSKLLEFYERIACSKFDTIIAATPVIRDKFLKINKNTVDVNNYPIKNELARTTNWSQKKDEIAYIGGIDEIRGIKEVVSALEYTENVQLNLAGFFGEKRIENEVVSYSSWSKVNALGFVSREQVAETLSYSKAGIVTFWPVPNHVSAQPNKMFEYMSAGIPVICSHFPLWKEIIDKNNCGICVDPLKPESIAEAIMFIINNPGKAEIMGLNGRKAIETTYNWANEESKLFNIYKELKF